MLRGIPRGEQTWVIESLRYATWRQPLTVAHLDQLKIGLMPRPVDLEAITVTANRLAERRRPPSYSVHAVSKEELRSSTAIEAADLEEIHSIDHIGGPWPQVRVYTERFLASGRSLRPVAFGCR